MSLIEKLFHTLVLVSAAAIDVAQGYATVTGTVFCDQCKDGQRSLFDYPIYGIRVTVACRDSEGRITISREETTNWVGNFGIRFDGTPDLSGCFAQVSGSNGQIWPFNCGAASGPPQSVRLLFSMFDMQFYVVDSLLSQPAQPMPFCPSSSPSFTPNPTAAPPLPLLPPLPPFPWLPPPAPPQLPPFPWLPPPAPPQLPPFPWLPPPVPRQLPPLPPFPWFPPPSTPPQPPLPPFPWLPPPATPQFPPFPWLPPPATPQFPPFPSLPTPPNPRLPPLPALPPLPGLPPLPFPWLPSPPTAEVSTISSSFRPLSLPPPSPLLVASACQSQNWTNPEYKCYWRAVGPDSKVGEVFGEGAESRYGADMTLWVGLSGKGDPYKTLLREGITSLLNSYNTILFPYPTLSVIQLMNSALNDSPHNILVSALRFKKANSGYGHIPCTFTPCKS